MTELSLDGLWTAEFGSTIGISGGGIVVFQGQQILGGDGGYFYQGIVKRDGNSISAEIVANPFNLSHSSIFATLGEKLELDLVGHVEDQKILAQGSLRNNPSLLFGVKLVKRV